MRKRVIRTINGILFAALFAAAVRPAVQEKLTADATTISQIEENIKGLEEEIKGLGQQIEGMEEKKEILEEEMTDLNAEIINTMTSIGLKEDEIAEKELEIENKQDDIDLTAKEYEEAKARETKQFEDTVKRLRKMYENGESGYLDQMLGGSGLGDMLNRMDYVEKVYEFDRMMLSRYEDTRNEVLALWNQLEVDKLDLEDAKTGLEADKANLETAKAELDTLLEKKKKQSANYASEIKKAQQAASVAKVKLKQEQQTLKQLQAAQNKSNAANGSYYTDYNSIIDKAEGSELGKQVARYACQYIGNPYVYGGTSLTNGADCSGFTYRVYKDFGYNLPRTSRDQQSVGKGVSYGEAQPGDLICYSGHVGIYIGGGKIVHASTEKTGIKVGNAGYRAIVAVRRII